MNLKKCDLCGEDDSQYHMIMTCKHPSMVFAGQEFQKIIYGNHNRLLRESKAQKYELVRRIHAVYCIVSHEEVRQSRSVRINAPS
jgi:hypothetical protein